jgi:cell division protein FtsI (penicillin-binding protein 3)
MDLRSPRVRLLLVAALALLWMGAALLRLGYLQLFSYTEYLTRAQRQQQRLVEISPRRGPVYDRHHRELAMSISVDSCFAVPVEIADPAMAAHLLSGVLDLSADEIQTKLSSSRSFVWIARKLPPEKAERIAALNLKGIYFQKENKRFYPMRSLAAHALGYVDIDELGQGGVEHELDEQIRSKPGRLLILTDARRRWIDSREKPGDAGASVVLTLDENIQYLAEKELARGIQETHASAGTVVIQDPSSGELLAVANWPTFNPNTPGESSAESRMDRAIGALYEPGSTFKIFTLSAALEEGITRPDEVVDCQMGAIYIAGHRIRDHKPFGLLSVSEILAHSSDVGAIKIGLRLGAPKLYEYLRRFGFGSPTGVDLPGESRGLLRRLENWTPVSVGSISMGQEVGVTPVQLVTAVSAIANGGLLYRPHIVQETIRGGQPHRADQPAPRRIVSLQTAATLRQMMQEVVLGGTGTKARLDGYSVAGKTGTAQKIDPGTGRYSASQYIASFIGFAPINSPAVTILVALDSPVGLHEGGQVAAPIFKRIAERVLPYLNVPHDIVVPPALERAGLRGKLGRKQAGANEDLSDFAPVQMDATAADLAASPAPLPTGTSNSAPTVELAEGEGVPVPALAGKAVRAATEECLRLGLSPILVGTGLAVEQVPEAGTLVRRGSRVTVRFSRSAALVTAASRRRK